MADYLEFNVCSVASVDRIAIGDLSRAYCLFSGLDDPPMADYLEFNVCSVASVDRIAIGDLSILM